MSRANVEMVRAGFERYWVDGEIWHLFDPDIVWHTRDDMPDAATYHGVEGVKSLIAAWLEPFARVEVEILETADVEDLVGVSLLWRGWMRGSDAHFELPEAQVWRVRDGKAVEVREFPSWEQALDAMGLRR